ncbi:transposase [Sporosarcina limicola]|uniref:Uncharacterized protein n=1 Tax=Sporosarcina limicola TaxID=34101 RepID=A0A927MLT2_9BACL|nr:transposase [Sporosarcina limicola]MBE1555457.1 hypothetical protein [Sporosarcina limicola]
MGKVKMYVSVVHQQVYVHPWDSPWEYEVIMDKEVAPVFKRLFNQMDRLEFRNFLRAHLPYVPYHYDKDNHDIDLRTMKVYALIHEYTDDHSKRFIEQLPYFR